MAQAQKTSVTAAVPNDLEAFFMPFTANRAFKARPRLIARAKDMHYYTPEGRPILDGAAGLWCTNAGHNRDPIVQAIQAQAASSISRRPSSSAIRAPSSWRAGSRRWRRAISTTCSSATPARRPPTPR